MVELDLKKITAPDFYGLAARPGLPALQVINEDAVPSIYWQPGAAAAKAPFVAQRAQRRAQRSTGVALSNPEPVLSVRTR